MICSNCKKEIANDSKFCEFCGNSVIKNISVVQISKESLVEKTLHKKVAYLVLLLCFAIFLFYWYELSPRQIRKQCNESADRESGGWEKDYDYAYKKCLRSEGL